jgi:Ulp1 family protease
LRKMKQCFLPLSARPQGRQLVGLTHLTNWMPTENFLQLERVFLPIKTDEAHFVMGYIDVRHKITYVFDSLGANRSGICFRIHCLVREVLGLSRAEWRESGWTWVQRNLSCVPRQPNTADCGLYVCLMANLIARGHGLNNIDVDLGPEYRRRLAIAMLEGKVE